jgi:hypothetical protein
MENLADLIQQHKELKNGNDEKVENEAGFVTMER